MSWIPIVYTSLTNSKLAARHRVGAHDGVDLGRQCFFAALYMHCCIWIGPAEYTLRAIGALCGVDGVDAVEHALHAVGQCLIGQVLIREYGVAASGRDLVAVQDRR